VDIENTVAQADAEDTTLVVKTSIDFPAGLWKEAKKAAIDKGVSAKQYVVDVVAEHLGLSNAA